MGRTRYSPAPNNDAQRVRTVAGPAVGTVVAVLYGYLYVILINEDYALLIGSFGLFAILGLIMYTTRHIDWYGARRTEE